MQFSTSKELCNLSFDLIKNRFNKFSSLISSSLSKSLIKGIELHNAFENPAPRTIFFLYSSFFTTPVSMILFSFYITILLLILSKIVDFFEIYFTI